MGDTLGPNLWQFLGLMSDLIFRILVILKYKGMGVYEGIWTLFKVYEGVWRYIKAYSSLIKAYSGLIKAY